MKIILYTFFLTISLNVLANVHSTPEYFQTPFVQPLPTTNDTIDFKLIARRTESDSTTYTWIDEYTREGIHMVYQDGNWQEEIKDIYIYNEEGKTIENSNLLYENGVCCTPNWNEVFEYNENNQITLRYGTFYKNEEWVDNYKYTYDYNENGKLTYRLEEYGESLKTFREEIYVYDQNGNEIIEEVIYHHYDQGEILTFIGGDKIENEYQNDLLSIQRSYVFTDLDSTWILSATKTYEYDEKGQLIFIYKDGNEEYLDNTIHNYEYDENGNMVLETYQKIIDDQIVNISQETNAYNQQNKLIEWIYHRWSNNQWESRRRLIYDYSDDDLLLYWSHHTFYRETNNWILNSDEKTEYDSNMNMILKERTDYNGDGTFYSKTQYRRAYFDEVDLNGRHRLIYTINETFIEEIGWLPPEFAYYYYDQNSKEASVSIPDSKLKIFPNPAQSTFQIELEYPFLSGCTLEIYSLDGQLIYMENLAFGYRQKIDLPYVQKGMYLVKLTRDGYQNSSLLQIN